MTFPVGLIRGSSRLLLCAASPFILGGCEQLNTWLGIKDVWAGYRDSTVNLISSQDLAVQDLTTAGFDSHGKWTWAWRGATDASDLTGFEYMTFKRNTSATPPSSLPSTTAVYDLELVNLYPSDAGDFEAATIAPPPYWSSGAIVGTKGVSFALATAQAGIHGTKALTVEIPGGNDARFDLAFIKDRGLSTAFHNYDFLFVAKGGAGYSTQVLDAASTFNADNSPKPVLIEPLSPVEYRIPQIPIEAASLKVLHFGNPLPTGFTMDDVRIIRSDITSAYRLRLLLLPTDTTPVLRGGYYEFSLWVRKSQGRFFVTEAGSVQPYAANRVSLSMRSLYPNPSGPEHAYPIDGSVDLLTGSSYDAGADWVRLSLRMNDQYNFDLDSGSKSAVVEIAVYPFDSIAGPRPGIVEIAGPELHFFFNGY